MVMNRSCTSTCNFDVCGAKAELPQQYPSLNGAQRTCISYSCLQVAVGFVLGGFAASWAAQPAPRKPTPAQEAIAASVASSAGAPSIAPDLYPEPASAPAGMRAVVQTACAFGNSLTMPLLFMLSLFPASMSSLATGAVALFLLGWSPMFWTLGHSRINGAANDILAETAARDEQPSSDGSGPNRPGTLSLYLQARASVFVPQPLSDRCLIAVHVFCPGSGRETCVFVTQWCCMASSGEHLAAVRHTK